MRNLWRSLLVTLSLMFCASAFAEGAHSSKLAPTAISISCVCHDAVGQAYVAAVKEILSKDPHFTQMEPEEGARRGAIRVHIMSLPITSTDGTPRAALSIVYTHDGNMVQQLIETCVHIPLADCAMSMVRDLKDMETSL